MDETITRLQHGLEPALLANRLIAWLPSLAVAVAVLIGGWLVHRALRTAMKSLLRRAGTDATAVAFADTVERYAVGTIVLVTALGELGVDTGSLLASLGVVGLTIGFAARDALSNVISGLFIFWDRPFVIGDLVEIDGRYGRVANITMRSTRLVTVDGKMIAIPNSVAVNTSVTSYTNFPGLRLDIALTVGVEEDLGRVRRLLLALAEGQPEFMAAPAPTVAVTAINDYNVAIVLRAWIGDERTHVVRRDSLREAAFEALRSANVHMPYNTIEVRSPPAGPDARDDQPQAH